MGTGFITGPAGPRAAVPMIYRDPWWGQFRTAIPGGGWIDVTKARDPSNVATPFLLSAGLWMGQITTGKRWAPSWIGTTTGAITGASTTLTIAAASAVELVRRIGASGTLTLTGPTAANGTARSRTITYSAVNTGTGDVTITAAGVNQVDQINLQPASTGGNIQLTIQKPDGTFATTASAAWNATDATYLAAINTQLDATSGVAGGIVASAIPATDTDLGFRLTYSGGAYAGNTWTAAQVALFPTSSTAATYTRVTSASSGAFVAGSIVGPTDGSQIPKSIIPNQMGLLLALDSASAPSIAEWAEVPDTGKIRGAYLVPAPTDNGIREWFMRAINGMDLEAFGDADLRSGAGKFQVDWAYPLS